MKVKEEKKHSDQTMDETNKGDEAYRSSNG
jgi:hypothetical protein